MIKTANLFTTDSYFNLFGILLDNLDGTTGGLKSKNLIFTEEKISLMTERKICDKFSGTFNTDVYSFGNYLRKNKSFNKILSKEGSAMAVRKILSEIPLNCFKKSRNILAPSLYELIVQLLSASVSPEDLSKASENATGILKDKLGDLCAVYSRYVEYLSANSFDDQSSALDYLPEIIENSEDIKRADIYIVGFQSFTAQIKRVIASLLKTAKSVTAILPCGDNPYAFVNETERVFTGICSSVGVAVNKSFVPSEFNLSAEIITRNLFDPKSFKRTQKDNKDIFYYPAKSISDETEYVAKAIKSMVVNSGKRYRDFTVIVPSPEDYKKEIADKFSLYGVPYFFDEKKKPTNHPVITLILAYFDARIKEFERESFLNFVKNPLVCEDKDFCDRFSDYVNKYGINYGKFKSEFTFPSDDTADLPEFENLRKKAVSLLSQRDIKEMLVSVSAKEKTEEFGKRLNALNKAEEKAVNEQVYDSVYKILSETELILSGVDIPLTERKNIFLSGVNALELSIIPQFNDAVFIGGFKEAGLVKNKVVFAVGLTESVPTVKEDIAVLTDSDIDALADLKVLIEPKISVVNKRGREDTATGLSAFSEMLFLSYPVSDTTGKKNFKSEVLRYAEKYFKYNRFTEINEYLTEEQVLREFSADIESFKQGEINDFTRGSTFYALKKEKAEPILTYSDKEIKERLTSGTRVLLKDITSPTAIEEFYKCPYRFFMTRALHIKEKEKGQVDALTVGNLMHEIFKRFVDKIGEIESEDKTGEVVRDIKEKLLQDKRYGRFLSDTETSDAVSDAVCECEKFCRKTYAFLQNSAFKPTPDSTEVKFGDGGVYPAISLLDGEIKLSGKIDRVDFYSDYCRVIDYKTGASIDASDKSFFAGNRLQLYLYASAVKDKKLAGAYYVKVADPYISPDKADTPLAEGKTLNDRNILICQDGRLADGVKSDFIPATIDGEKIKKTTDSSVLEAYKKYALKMCENAVKELKDGVIIPSPYAGECEYCGYKAVCGFSDGKERTLNKVDESTVKLAVEESERETEEKEI